MRSVEITIQNLITTGFDPRLENNPYLLFTFTSFQVCVCARARFIRVLHTE